MWAAGITDLKAGVGCFFFSFWSTWTFLPAWVRRRWTKMDACHYTPKCPRLSLYGDRGAEWWEVVQVTRLVISKAKMRSSRLQHQNSLCCIWPVLMPVVYVSRRAEMSRRDGQRDSFTVTRCGDPSKGMWPTDEMFLPNRHLPVVVTPQSGYN